jgi:hypothetical protein
MMSIYAERLKKIAIINMVYLSILYILLILLDLHSDSMLCYFTKNIC